MDFQLTDDQRALKDGTRELLAGRFGRDRLRAAVEDPAPDRALWCELGAAGFFALRLPERDGGVGLGLPEAVLVLEEAGRALLPGPLVACQLLAGAVDGVAAGERIAVLCDGAREPLLWEHPAGCDELILLEGGEGPAGARPTAGRRAHRGARAVRTGARRTGCPAPRLLPSTLSLRSPASWTCRAPNPSPWTRPGSAARPPCSPRPSSSAAPSARSRRRPPMPANASSSASPSARSRPSSSCARRCWYGRKSPEVRCMRRRSRRVLSTSRARNCSPTRPRCATPGTVCRSTAGWASPGRPMSICTSSGPGGMPNAGGRRARPRKCWPRA
ncbi:acyl-CoA dehydrogenase family protein [Streptomyces sp. RPA4-5]|nr:acyl-CoA dehydrogenase family protein [Streptomyces sp. RPA4-5]